MKRSFVILLHAGYWILYLLLLLLFVFFIRAGNGNLLVQPGKFVFDFIRIMSMFTIIPGLIGFYTFYTLLFNRYLSKKRIGALCIAAFVTIFLAGLIGFLGLNLATRGVLFTNNSGNEMRIMVCFMSVLSLIHGTIALVMKGFITWYGDIKFKEELKQQHFETELALVKSQLSPHFLFNTINNIDVLIEKDAVKASVYLNKLSDIMRFMLYETKTDHISLQKELEYIGKYIGLQKIRSPNQNFVKFTVHGDTDKWMIAPMLFIPFIENAFKHTADKKTDHAIRIQLEVTETALRFFCENSFSEHSLLNYEAGGLGNELIKKRLNLLYPGAHTVNVTGDNNIYKVELSIQKEVKIKMPHSKVTQ
ncbi:MAG: histidine kinase [Ferruginibacter sp.]